MWFSINRPTCPYRVTRCLSWSLMRAFDCFWWFTGPPSLVIATIRSWTDSSVLTSQSLTVMHDHAAWDCLERSWFLEITLLCSVWLPLTDWSWIDIDSRSRVFKIRFSKWSEISESDMLIAVLGRLLRVEYPDDATRWMMATLVHHIRGIHCIRRFILNSKTKKSLMFSIYKCTLLIFTGLLIRLNQLVTISFRIIASHHQSLNMHI